MHWTDEWLNVFFNDETKFKLDYPYDWTYYLHVLRPHELFSRQNGGVYLMMLGILCFNKTTNIAFLNGRQCSEDSQNILKSNLFLIGSRRVKLQIPTGQCVNSHLPLANSLVYTEFGDGYRLASYQPRPESN